MTEFGCKHCGSKAIVRYGQSPDGTQYWWCKVCERKFADNDALPRMRTPVDQIGHALLAFYDGASLTQIRRQFEQQYDNSPSDPAIYGWITRFTQVVIDKTKNLKPNVGDTWVADETVLNIDGRNIWFWDVMDSKTRFLLASHMSGTRDSNDAEILMREAAKRAGKSPKVVITDKLLAYTDGIERAFGADSKHVQSKGFKVQPNTNLIERLHGSIKDRTKVMRGLKSIPTAYLFMDGWATHYNYFREHSALGKTPAEAAGVKSPFKNWLDVAGEPEKPFEVPSIIERGARFEEARRHRPRKHYMRFTRERETPAPSLSRIRTA